MTITGDFNDYKNNRTYSIEIRRNNDVLNPFEVMDYKDDEVYDGSQCICWSPVPITLEVDYSDTFTHNIVRAATINFITNFDMTSLLLANNANDIYVTISVEENNTTTDLFYGTVSPLVFNEPYAYNWNEVSLTANDILSSAQYIKYPNIVLSKMNDMMIFLNDDEEELGIINTIADRLGLTVDSTDLNQEIVQAMEGTKIANSLFGGESPDDWMSCFDVLEEIGKYWGVWFMVVGDTLKMIDWHNEERIPSAIKNNIQINQPKEDFSDDSTNLSTADAYTQIKLSCDIDNADSIVEFGDDLVSPYPHYALYMEELIAEGNGSTAQDLFKKLLLNDETGSNEKHPTESYKYKNFCWVKKSNLWDFGPNGYTKEIDNGATQQGILHWLWSNPGKGAFVSFGRTDKMSVKDDSPINSLELQDGLIISICGQDSPSHESTMQSNFNSAGPICSFTGSSKQFTPSDSSTTNYLIISGKIFLNKMYAKTGPNMHYNYNDSKKSGEDYDKANGCLYLDYNNTYQSLLTLTGQEYTNAWNRMIYHNAVPRIGSNDYGCFYTQRYYNGDAGSEQESTNTCLCGDLKQDKYQKTWKYEYSYVGDYGKAVDNTSKIPVLRCQLKIGNKYCVERIDLGTEGWGKFQWLTEEQIKGQEPIDGAVVTGGIKFNNEFWYDMTIGFNPKIDDYIVGQNYDIQNTLWYYDDVDGTGTAIPIKLSDGLGGEVTFTIKQPMFSYWEVVGGGHRIRSLLFGIGGTYPVLEKLESIILSNFKIELTSDKGHIMNNTENNDLVYASDENDDYIEEHEDSVKIATMITSQEAADWSTEMVISDSHVVNLDNSPFYGFEYDTGEVDEDEQPIMAYIKPEQLYVNNFYLEYNTPKQVVDTALKIKNIDWLINPDKYKFKFGFLDGNYVPIRYEANLKYNTMSFSMKDMTYVLEQENI